MLGTVTAQTVNIRPFVRVSGSKTYDQIVNTVYEPGTYAADGSCTTFGQSAPWIEIDLGTAKNVRTVYVMGSQYTGKWGDLTGVEMFVTAS